MIIFKLVFISFESLFLKEKEINTIESLIFLNLSVVLKKNEEFLSILIQQIINLILLKREEKLENSLNLSKIIEFLQMSDIYQKDFEPKFLEISEQYFSNYGQNITEKNNLCIFLQSIEKTLEKEQIILDNLVLNSTKQKIIIIIENEIIFKNLKFILGEDLIELFKKNDLESLKKVFQILERIKKEEFLKNSFNDFIKTKGIEILSEKNIDILHPLLFFKKKGEEILEKCFLNSQIFKTGLDNSFDYVINFKTNFMAEKISNKIDEKLRINPKQKEDDNKIIEDLNNLFEIFRFISAKDVFEAFYTKRLIKRILLGLMNSQELENYFIIKLRKGYKYLRNLIKK